jgi:serine/threonine protein phosphatase PrpC
MCGHAGWGEAVTSLRIESGAKSHEGRVRERNEDSFVAQERHGLWAVADGMGGAANGDWASAKLAETIGEIRFPLAFDAACEAIANAIHRANADIYERSVKRGRQMGSTIVALFVQDKRFVVFWVGDSRAYLLRDGALHRVSRDHSQVQEMIDRGLIDAKDAEGHPMGHVLARAVGVGEDLDLDAVQGEVEPGDVFLLCSDGLHGYVPEADIARLLGRGTPDEAVEHLVSVTLERGAPDNVTVIAVGFSEPTLLSLPQTVTA